MTLPASRDEARARVRTLVEQFQQNEAESTRTGTAYNETQARTEFVTPLLEALGWDVQNTLRQPLDLREVFEEATVEVGEERLSKKPDYELRAARQRKFFVEAKKPSVRIDRDRGPSFQTRRYGFSASLPVSVLTNFNQLAIYDCVPVPREDDEAHVARLQLFSYREFVTRFDELYDMLSREAVYSGRFDAAYGVAAVRHGTQQFDDHFLRQVRSWRERLAKDIHENNPDLSPEELSYTVQLFLSRIVFLRICEDRDIEKYETLKELNGETAFDSLMDVVRRADRFYDSGLFRLLDDERLGVRISDEVLAAIIAELYYPQSPYTFSVVEAGVLGEIYEQFLGEVISINAEGEVEVVLKPEVRDSGGVVPTPRYVVDAILQRTLAPVIAGRRPNEFADFTVADICCGSGVFLLGAFEHLLNHHLNWYIANDRGSHVGSRIYEVTGGQWRLMFAEKRRLLLQCIRGVDIDSNAVEVARFSLLLRLIQDETAAALEAYERAKREPVLPDLDGCIRHGNSLVSHEEFAAFDPDASPELLGRVTPFTWATEFPAEMGRGGFDVIVGNPPYIRIQNMVTYSPEEVEFYQRAESPYTTAQSHNFDKYALFIERSVQLLGASGRLGFIVPNKFMTLPAGRAVRALVTAERMVEELVYFGAQQVFGGDAANYTCILVLAKSGADQVRLEKVLDLARWKYGEAGQLETIPADRLGDEPWTIASAPAQGVFDRIRARFPTKLDDVADIFVGVQTSADDIYIIEAEREMADAITFTWENREWTVEREILRPCLHDVQLHAYTPPNPNKFMIFPYRLGGARAVLIQPEEMEASYPRAWAYLNARRARLEERKVSGGPAAERQFYQYGRSQSLTKFDSPKIVLPILSREPRYAYDDQNIVVTGGGNGPYYLVRPREDSPHSLFFLLALLCHPLSEAMVRTRTSVFRGGYYSHGKQFIEVLPVPGASEEQRREVEDLVGRAIRAAVALQAARTPPERTTRQRELAALRDRVEDSLTRILGLSDDDLAAVLSVAVPT
jgi:Eco57I restriction-modification methylase